MMGHHDKKFAALLHKLNVGAEQPAGQWKSISSWLLVQSSRMWNRNYLMAHAKNEI